MSPGTESFMDATSALHHATPSKSKILSFFSFYLFISLQLFTSPFKQEMTHKQYCLRTRQKDVCVCSHRISCFCPIVGRISLLFSADVCFYIWISRSFSAVAKYDCCILCFLTQGAVLSPSMEHPMSLQPSAMLAPLTQQMGHLSLGGTATV